MPRCQVGANDLAQRRVRLAGEALEPPATPDDAGGNFSSEIVFGRKVVVESGLGDAGSSDDRIDADCPYPLLIEEVIRSVQHILARRLGRPGTLGGNRAIQVTGLPNSLLELLEDAA